MGASSGRGIIDIPVAGKLSRDNCNQVSSADQLQCDGQADDAGARMAGRVSKEWQRDEA